MNSKDEYFKASHGISSWKTKAAVIDQAWLYGVPTWFYKYGFIGN